MLFAPKKFLSDCRVAVVLGAFISDQVGPCHSEIVNESLSLFPFWLRQSILEVAADNFF